MRPGETVTSASGLTVAVTGCQRWGVVRAREMRPVNGWVVCGVDGDGETRFLRHLDGAWYLEDTFRGGGKAGTS